TLSILVDSARHRALLVAIFVVLAAVIRPRRRRPRGRAAKVVQELERRAVLAGYSHIYLTTGFRQPEAVKLYLSQGYEAQFDLTRDPEEYSQPPYDGRLRFTKALAVSAYSHSA
ncbi:hypothetical protein WOC75_25275, partial [Klebsiella pneumoniae]